MRRVGESKRDYKEVEKSPIIMSERNLGEWPLRNTSESTNPVDLSPVSR